MNARFQEFINVMKHPFKGTMFMLTKLPSAYFSGVRVHELTQDKAIVTVPYKWFSQNPFRSTYFACLAMAAEMSTGLLALMQLYKRHPSVSMLVVKLEANYFKKATGLTRFTCEAGKDFERIVDECIRNGEARTYVATSTGRNEDGDVVAEFYITWSFKAKSNN
ncbi:MAG: PaaI family thioesterase [Chitinophagaceae bacterium]